MCRRRCQAAFTLIEIIVTLVVVGIAAVALLGVFTSNVRGSADPLIQQQAITIAEAYMEEIMLRAYDDPTDPEQGTSGTEAGETSRDLFDDVQDYNHLGTTEVRNQNDVAIAALSAYAVTVSVTGATLNSVPAMLIDIRVDHPAISQVRLNAYRTDY
ncbi:MAG: type II secretion system protein [Gammaproteobacteria bacterium]|nr:type II secretion system protein [Gammaproteobacteria bacterium]